MPAIVHESIYDYSKLIGRIIEKFGTRTAFQEAMGMSSASMSFRLNGKSMWTDRDIEKAIGLLDIPRNEIGDYFFTLKKPAS